MAGVKVRVIKSEVVAPNGAWSEHRLPLTNLDRVVPPIDLGGFFCYNKPNEQVDALKTSLSKALALFYPLAGEIVTNAAGELEIYCNYKGVDFIEAVADVELRELNFYNPQEILEGKLMPMKHHGVLAIQVTILKCGGMVIACLFDHRVVDAYSLIMFTSSWANMTTNQPPPLFPYFGRSELNPRHTRHYTPSVANMFVPLSSIQSNSTSTPASDLDQDSIINRIYYINGDQIKRLQLLASENGHQRSKIESFAAFIWKITASFLDYIGLHGYTCNIALPVDGRRSLSKGEGAQKEKLMVERFGNVFSMPFRGIGAKELKDLPLSWVANKIHELFKSTTTKEHFKELIDWVEDQRPKPLISRPFVEAKAFSFMVSSGLKLSLLGDMDFGWGKPVLMSCHVSATRTDCHVMPMVSPTNEDDWVVYMHLPRKLLNYMEEHANYLLKPLTAHYLKLVLNPCVPRL